MDNKTYSVESNSVGKEAARTVQLAVLKEISDIVMRTAGPKGSTTMILKPPAYPIYTKDGKKVADHVNIFGEVEHGILDQIIQIVEKVVSRVGDGTTSAIRLTYLIFKGLMDEFEYSEDGKINSNDIVVCFKEVVEKLSSIILSKSRQLTTEDVFSICMISTNGNEEISSRIQYLYEKYGNGVYIDLKSSHTTEYMIKEYDGLSIAKGYASPSCINKKKESLCDIRNPHIYVFKDPIDTPEMLGFFTRIVHDNILTPFNNIHTINRLQNNPAAAKSMTKSQLDELEKNSKMVPTVIMCPFISRDASTVLESLDKLLHSFDTDETTMLSKPPIAIVNNLSANLDELSDLSTLCGCKVIGKYIDPTVQEKDIKSGVAPTVDTVTSFYGTADQVIISRDYTKFVNPSNMFEKDENGKFKLDENNNLIYSTTYNSLISFLKSQLELAEKEHDDLVEIRMLKRRLNGLTSCLAELYIGGLSVTDRESAKDLADDAVRNCRSAAVNGVGRAANFEGYLAARDLIDEYDAHKENGLNRKIAHIIKKSYRSVINEIYTLNLNVPEKNIADIMSSSITYGMPINLRTGEHDGTVLSSIDSDIAVLDCVTRIVSIMFVSNQILVSSPMNNSYASISSVKQD